MHHNQATQATCMTLGRTLSVLAALGLTAGFAAGELAWQTGQTPTAPYAAPAGSDGKLQKGVAWPNPRFTDSGDGTVTDNLTGLVWLKGANYNNTSGGKGTATWANALTFCNALRDGQCGLSDGSAAGDWRLPNFVEMMSLIAWQYHTPPICNAAGDGKWTTGDPFDEVQTAAVYWTSTARASGTTRAYGVSFGDSSVGISDNFKTTAYRVWPVRDGPTAPLGTAVIVR